MKAIKLIVVFFVVYVGIVVAFETLIGVFQPATDTTLVITTTGDDDVSNDRVLARLESDGQLYVAANHWPRAWYNEALENPAFEPPALMREMVAAGQLGKKAGQGFYSW